MTFPAPPSPDIADRIESTAAQLKATFPYRNLIDCRELAARLVHEILSWDAMWPEAEGDCGCPDYLYGLHHPECLWAVTP